MTKHEYPPIADNGLEQCVRCGVTFGTEDTKHAIGFETNVTYGPVIRANSGQKEDIVLDASAGTELVHEDCWDEMEADRRRGENQSLEQWAATE